MTFLLLLAKYVPWVRLCRTFRDVVVANVRDHDEDLRLDPEYDQAHQDDLDALTAFRKTIGLNLHSGNSNKSPRSAASIRFNTDGVKKPTTPYYHIRQYSSTVNPYKTTGSDCHYNVQYKYKYPCILKAEFKGSLTLYYSYYY